MIERVARAIRPEAFEPITEGARTAGMTEFLEKCRERGIEQALKRARAAIEAMSQTAPDAWRYRFDGGKWTVQKNKPSWHQGFMVDVILEPLFSIDAALKGEAE